MLHIVLLILKIIGIVFLCIIGVIILALLGVLFVPVRYRIEVVREEGEDKPPVDARVKITWFLHLLNILIRYPAEIMVRVRLMIFTIFKIPEKQNSEGQEQKKPRRAKAKRDKEKDVKEEEGKEKDDTKVSDNHDAGTREQEEPGKGKNGQKNESRNTDKAEESIPRVTIKTMQPEEDSGEEEVPSFIDKLRAIPVIIQKIIQKIKSLFENIQYTIQRFCDKIKSISDNIQYYKTLVESESFQNSFRLCKEELAAILKSLKPQRFEAKLIVGMDDPATTGEILAVFGMLYPMLGGHVDVAGDFEKKRIEGRIFIKGKIRVWTFLRTAVRVYFNKDIKRLLRLLKKEAANGRK